MTEETKAPVTETKKPTTKSTPRKPAMDRSKALKILRDANYPIDEKIGSAEIIAIAKLVPDEKYYNIIIQEREDTNAQAYIGVNNVPFFITRGEEVVVPARVVEALKNAVGYTPYQTKDHTTGKIVIRNKRFNAELYTVIGEVPKP